MSELKCPFCQQEYIITKDDSCFGQRRCVCRNPNCEFDGWHFPVKLVSELIRTRKALELAITGLKNCKTRDHIGAVCRTPEYVDGVLKQISDIADYNQPVDDPMDKIHKAVDKTNKKLQNNLEIAVDGLSKIAYSEAVVSGFTMMNIARETLNKIKE